MGRYFDTSSALATLATTATERTKSGNLSQKSQLSQQGGCEKLTGDNFIDLRDAFEERAAIMEYDGGMSRADAERAAALDTGFDPDKSDILRANFQSLNPSEALGKDKGRDDGGT